MRRIASRTIDSAVTAESIVTTSLMVLVILTLTLQVVSRYVFSSPLGWTEEFARYCLIWLTFFGSAVLSFTPGHLGIGDDDDRIRTGPRTWWDFATAIFGRSLEVVTTGIISGSALFYHNALGIGLSPSLRFPLSLVFLFVAIAVGLWCINALVRLVYLLNEVRQARKEALA